MKITEDSEKYYEFCGDLQVARHAKKRPNRIIR